MSRAPPQVGKIEAAARGTARRKTSPISGGSDTRAAESDDKPAEFDKRKLARLAANGMMGNAITMVNFASGMFGKELSGFDAFMVLRETADNVHSGDLSSAEMMLTAQAAALNAIFGELARRSALNMGEHLDAAERYMRLALKAQGQCRTTLETLAAIKNPPVVYARQANINHGGQQQVNNGAVPAAGVPPTRAENSETAPNGLLELPKEAGLADSARAGSHERAQPEPIQAGKAA